MPPIVVGSVNWFSLVEAVSMFVDVTVFTFVAAVPFIDSIVCLFAFIGVTCVVVTFPKRVTFAVWFVRGARVVLTLCLVVTSFTLGVIVVIAFFL